MSRLQEAVDRFAAQWKELNGEPPTEDTIWDGTFSRQSGQPFCLCYRPLAMMIDFAGLDCTLCGKPYTEESNAWFDEARAERAKGAGPPSSDRLP
jgi:hypothetical protein